MNRLYKCKETNNSNFIASGHIKREKYSLSLLKLSKPMARPTGLCHGGNGYVREQPPLLQGLNPPLFLDGVVKAHNF